MFSLFYFCPCFLHRLSVIHYSSAFGCCPEWRNIKIDIDFRFNEGFEHRQIPRQRWFPDLDYRYSTKFYMIKPQMIQYIISDQSKFCRSKSIHSHPKRAKLFFARTCLNTQNYFHFRLGFIYLSNVQHVCWSCDLGQIYVPFKQRFLFLYFSTVYL